MKIIDVILEEAPEKRLNLVISASLAGISTVLIMHLVGTFMQSPTSLSLRLLFLSILAIGVYAFAARRTCYQLTDVIEGILYRLRIRIVGKIQYAELQGIERLGTAEIYARLTENVAVIATAAWTLSHFVQSFVILVAASLYIAWLSSAAFAIIALLLILGLGIYGAGTVAVLGHFKQLAQTRLTFLEALTDLLQGFKEVKHSRKRNQELGEDIAAEATALHKGSSRANYLFIDNWVLVNCVLYVILIALVTVLPRHLALKAEALSMLVPSVLFIWGPLMGIMRSYPEYLRANQALVEIEALAKKLDSAVRPGAAEERTEPGWEGPLMSITAHNIQYQYPDDKGGSGFCLGPLSLTIKGGEILFIVGGNGSGKSTLLKTLTGLYAPTGGTLHVNGVLVQPGNAAAYRELSSAIYSDFHLFKKLYGLLDIEEAAIHRLLTEMQLDGKTAFRNHAFTKRDLSTGQRKRLAMIVALLEDRPLYLLDEWAADQDPEFRHHFYMEILPALKQRGKTVIAVCHDDRYFHCADRVVTMEYGQLREGTLPS